MPVRTRVIAEGLVTGNGTTQTIFTCPTDRVAIVKDMRLRVVGTAGLALLIAVRGAGARLVWRQPASAANDNLIIEGPDNCWLVLEEGDLLRAFVFTGDTLDYWLSGTLLEGDAS